MVKKNLLLSVSLFVIAVSLSAQSWESTTGGQWINGKVGIGIGDPLCEFHIKKSVANSLGPVLLLQNGQYEKSSGASSAIRFLGSAALQDRYMQLEGVMGNLSKPSRLSVVFNNDGNIIKPFTVRVSGNVGIGTESPLERFHIRKDMANNIGPVLLLQNGQYENSNGAGSAIRFLGSANEAMLDRYIQLEGTMGELSKPNRFSIVFSNDGKVIKPFTVKSSGNVGIGITNPSAKLHVDGKIIAEEIKIEMVGNTADFVFEPNYNLRPLEEVESFVKENKHLPEVAPAKEMEENGVNQGEMNQKLLQKIEELTLYMIDAKKEIKSLKEEIRELKNN